jgi:hypothetical protein
MKKVLSVLMVASMVSFVACKGKKAEETPVDSSTMAPAMETTTPPAPDSSTMNAVEDTAKAAEGKMEEHKEEAKH